MLDNPAQGLVSVSNCRNALPLQEGLVIVTLATTFIVMGKIDYLCFISMLSFILYLDLAQF